MLFISLIYITPSHKCKIIYVIDEQMVEIEVKGPDDKQIAKIHADKPHKHVTLVNYNILNNII